MSVAIYIDVLFFTNFVINTCIIYISSVFLCRKIRLFRLISSGVILAFYSCVMFFPDFSFLFTLISKIIFFGLTTLITFPTKDFKHIIKNTLTVFLTYTLVGGIMYALIFFTDLGYKTNAAISNGEIYLNLSTFSLALSFAVSIILVICFFRLFRQSRTKASQLYNAKIVYGKNQTELIVLGDTGCNAKDPFTQKPVMIIDGKTANNLIPSNFFISEKFAKKWRIVPYSTVSQKSDVLMGFIPDELYINRVPQVNITVAISKTMFSSNAEYHGIINPSSICERTDVNAEPAVT